MRNLLYLKHDGDPELASNQITEQLTFLGLTEAPSIVHNYREETMHDGQIWNYSRYGQTTVTAKFLLQYTDHVDFKLAKHAIYRALMQKGIYRLRTATEPNVVRYCRVNNFTIEPEAGTSNYVTFDVPFDNPRGLKYSKLYSDQMDEDQLREFGLNFGDEYQLSYHFAGQTSFKVFNASDITVDPYGQDHALKITMRHNGGAFGLKNTTTGTTWNYKQSLGSGDTLVLDGIRTLKNNQPDSASTDYQWLTLAPGWNQIEVTGASDLDVTFSFPFMYLG